LVENAWFALAVGVAWYAVGYVLYVYEAYLYHAGAKNYVVFQGSYELTPALQGAVVKRRFLDGRFVAILLVLGVGILAAWAVIVQRFDRPDIFSFLMGGLLLLEAAVGMRRFRNIVFFRHAQSAESPRGKIEYSRRFVLTQYVFELYAFVALYLLIFLVSGGWFFLGGALTCFVASRRLRDWVMVRA
jgi:hypothetical protein